jgi:hypothetical protein
VQQSPFLSHDAPSGRQAATFTDAAGFAVNRPAFGDVAALSANNGPALKAKTVTASSNFFMAFIPNPKVC